MSNTTIGQAYVQILPSMKGMAAAINRGGSSAVSSGGKNLGSKLGSGMASTVTKVVAAAGIGTALASSISEGGKLQQSLGGVETLFGNAAETVKKNAANAWKAVGMSANEYMEQTTSFAASLVSSLNGDTRQAANLADVAMQDMSDNANKMGTDMTNITNAYQGFAKQNYTMLDNLKLGYGGTKTEMQRLIADASKMTGVQDKLGVSVDSTSLSYDNIVKAIHVVQANMGVMGTTSKEAATTLTGSVSMMKSSWTDFLGQLSLGGDMTQPLENLVNSVVTFGANLAPLAANIASGIANMITSTDWGSIIGDGMDNLDTTVKDRIASFDFGSAISSAFSSLSDIGGSLAGAGSMGLDLVNMISDSLGNADWAAIASTIGEKLSDVVSLGGEGLTELVDTGVNLVESIGQGLEAAIPELLDKALPMLSDFSGTLRENAGTLVDCGLDLVNMISDSLGNADWAAIASTIGEKLSDVVSLGGEGLTELVDTGVNLVESIGQGLEVAIPELLDKVLPMLSDFSGTLRENAGTLVDCGLDLITNIADGLINAIPTLVENVPTIITNLAGIINDNAPKVLATGVTIIANLALGLIQAIPTLVANIPQILQAIVSVITAFNWINLGKTIVTAVGNGIKALKTKLPEIAKSAVEKLKSVLSSGATGAANVFKGGISGVTAAVKTIFTKMFGIAKNIMVRFKTTISSGARGAATSLKNGITRIPGTVKSIFGKAWSIIKGIVAKFKGAFKFSWSLPHLKVPHVSVSGGKAPYGIGGKGSLPHFNVSWAAKGGVLDGATLIGAGEAGKEALLPLERNTGWMDTLAARVNAKQTGTTVTMNVTVNGADNPEEWGRRMASELRRQVKMA